MLCFSLGLSGAALAQGDDGMKIAVVDVLRAVLQTEKALQRLEELKGQEDFKGNLEKLEGLRDEYKEMVESYQKNRAVMSAEKRGDEEKRLLDKQNDIKYITSKLKQAQNEMVESVMAEIGSSAITVVENLIKEQGIDLLLRKDGAAAEVVLHVDDAYDISAVVTERLNQIK